MSYHVCDHELPYHDCDRCDYAGLKAHAKGLTSDQLILFLFIDGRCGVATLQRELGRNPTHGEMDWAKKTLKKIERMRKKELDVIIRKSEAAVRDLRSSKGK